MKEEINAIILLSFFLISIFCYSCGPTDVPKGKVADLERFVKKEVKEAREADYRNHNIDIEVVVTGLKIERLTMKETKQDNEYFVQGKASYMIKGKRNWEDKEGNVISLEPEQNITHWFSCGILEDKYIGVLFKDNKNRLTFYADNPIR